MESLLSNILDFVYDTSGLRAVSSDWEYYISENDKAIIEGIQRMYNRSTIAGATLQAILVNDRESIRKLVYTLSIDIPVRWTLLREFTSDIHIQRMIDDVLHIPMERYVDNTRLDPSAYIDFHIDYREEDRFFLRKMIALLKDPNTPSDILVASVSAQRHNYNLTERMGTLLSKSYIRLIDIPPHNQDALFNAGLIPDEYTNIILSMRGGALTLPMNETAFNQHIFISDNLDMYIKYANTDKITSQYLHIAHGNILDHIVQNEKFIDRFASKHIKNDVHERLARFIYTVIEKSSSKIIRSKYLAICVKQGWLEILSDLIHKDNVLLVMSNLFVPHIPIRILIYMRRNDLHPEWFEYLLSGFVRGSAAMRRIPSDLPPTLWRILLANALATGNSPLIESLIRTYHSQIDLSMRERMIQLAANKNARAAITRGLTM